MYIAAMALGALAIGQLWVQAQHGTFATDECFHATAAQVVGREHSLPAIFPEFYSGFYYYYQPLFHVVGALWIQWFGPAALHVLPPALFAALLVALLARPLGAGSAIAGAWAALLCLTNASLLSYATRLYAEGLVTLLATGSIVCLAAVLRRPSWPRAIALGVVTGAALLTKFNAWVLLGPTIAGTIVAWRRGRNDLARALGAAALIAVALALPHLVRNQLLYGSAIYPALAPDLDRALYALNHAKFSTDPLAFYARFPRAFGLPLVALVVGAIVATAWRRSIGWREGVLGLSLLGVALVPLVPFGADRHLNPFMPVLALVSASLVIEALAPRRWMVAAIGLTLVVLAGWRLTRLENQRLPANLPVYLREAFPEVASRTPKDALILSLWTYDTAYYTGRRATWPNPWGQKTHPVEMFTEREPARFLEELRRHRIDFILMPRTVGPARFDSANYPESFAANTSTLLDQGRIDLAWMSDNLILIRVPRQ